MTAIIQACEAIGPPEWDFNDVGIIRAATLQYDKATEQWYIGRDPGRNKGGRKCDLHEARALIETHFLDWLSKDGRYVTVYGPLAGDGLWEVVVEWDFVGRKAQRTDDAAPSRLEALASAVLAVKEKS